MYDKLEKIVASGAKVVLSKLPIGDVATQYFADRYILLLCYFLIWHSIVAMLLPYLAPYRDVFCAGRVVQEDLRRTMKACGGAIQTSVNNLTDDVLGYCQLFEESQIGGERCGLYHIRTTSICPPRDVKRILIKIVLAIAGQIKWPLLI